MADAALSNLTPVNMPQMAIGTKRVPVVNDLHFADERTTQVGAAGTWTGTWIEAKHFAKIVGFANFDTNGTLYVDQSSDGYNADYSWSTATAGTVVSFSVELIAPFVRLRWINAGAATSTHKAKAYLKVMS